MTCLRCGACCIVWGIYEVSIGDACRLPRHVFKFCDLYKDMWMMRTRGFHCICLDKANRCKIYDDRPTVCRRFRPGSLLCRMARTQLRKLQ